MKDAGATSAPQVSVGHGLVAYFRAFVQAVGWPRLTAAVALVLACTVLESVGLLMLVPLLQMVGGEASAPALRWLVAHGLQPGLGAVLLLFLGVMLVRVLLSRRRDVVLMHLRVQFVDGLRARIEHALAMARWSVLVRMDHGELMHLLFDQLARVNQGSAFLMQGLAGLGLAVASVAVSLAIAPGFTVAVCVPLALLVMVLGRRLGTLVAMGSRAGQAQRDLLSAARDFLAGLKLVKAHAAEARHLHEFSRRAARVAHEQAAFMAHQAWTRGVFELGGAVLLSLLVYAAATWGHMALPELLLLVLVFARLMPVVREGHVQVQQVAHMLPAFTDVQCAVARLQQASEVDVAAAVAGPPADRHGDIRFERIGLRYEGAGDAWALRDVSLVLTEGTTSVLVGPSGAGKTTLVDVAMGLLLPQHGSVSVGGMALRDGAALRQWRRHVAYVPQEPYLFAGSIRQNLCWLDAEASDDALWAALTQADADAFVRALPGGLDHPLGERGAGLSGGERQRLSLARALLSQPRLLVLDEPTSQLDAESQARVFNTLAGLRGRYTVLVVAHRLETLRDADQILVLDGGRLVQSGTWLTLSQEPGRFQALLATHELAPQENLRG